MDPNSASMAANDEYYHRYGTPQTQQQASSRSTAAARSLEDLIDNFSALSEQQDSPVLGRRPSIPPDDSEYDPYHHRGQSCLSIFGLALLLASAVLDDFVLAAISSGFLVVLFLSTPSIVNCPLVVSPLVPL